MVRPQKPPSQTWRTFLENHIKTLVSLDFFTCRPSGFRSQYVFLVPAHDRRRVVHFGLTAHATADWTASNSATPFRGTPHHVDLLRDRDRIFGDEFTQVKDMDIPEVLRRRDFLGNGRTSNG